MLVIGGESAGELLTAWVALWLRDHEGINYTLTYTPSARTPDEQRLVTSLVDLCKFNEAAFPLDVFPPERREDRELLTLYAELSDMPPALFLVGELDVLVGDSMFMATRWALAGNEAELAIVAESPMHSISRDGGRGIGCHRSVCEEASEAIMNRPKGKESHDINHQPFYRDEDIRGASLRSRVPQLKCH
ncbi:hypothetical protein LTS15_004609 [Exophiala xenobiotica]|nr:hypothetical protein LTS15_004609 [Exophiala xenobiotica]